jgi:hypothetical protein
MKSLLALLLLITTGAATAQSGREDIEITFDRHKGKLYAEYVKALRQHPGLSGKVELDFDISRTGAVTACRVRSRTLPNADLPKKLCDRIMEFKFAPRAEPITVPKTLDFFPAA